ncbi:MAG: hypothetical protein QXS37_03190 [Candidatus Aenigmatarchaeota archaeon]
MKKKKYLEIEVPLNKQVISKLLRIIIGILFIILGLYLLFHLKEISPAWLLPNFFIGIIFILTGYGILRKRLKTVYKNFLIFLICLIVFFSFLLFSLLNFLVYITSRESFVELSKIYWRYKVENYFSVTPSQITEYGRIFCYTVDYILNIPVPCNLINTQNIDQITEYLANRYYPNSEVEKMYNSLKLMEYPLLAIGILFSTFLFLINKAVKPTLKQIGLVLAIIGVLLVFTSPAFLYLVKELPQFKNLSEETVEMLESVFQQRISYVGFHGIVYLCVGISFILVGYFLPKKQP